MTTNSDFPTPADEGRFRQLLAAARGIVRCDAAALLRLQGEVLVPVAVHGLSDDALGRRFPSRLIHAWRSCSTARTACDSPPIAACRTRTTG